MSQATLAGQGAAFAPLALVRPLLEQGRLVLARACQPSVVNDGYWLVACGVPLSEDAALVRDALLAEA